jgi:importin-7
LYGIGSLFEKINFYKELRATVEPMMINFVLPELRNP